MMNKWEDGIALDHLYLFNEDFIFVCNASKYFREFHNTVMHHFCYHDHRK